MSQTSYSPVPLSMQDWYPWCQLLARGLNNLLGGKQNATTTITLTASTTTTTLFDSRIGSKTGIYLSALTANAAGVAWWISSQQEGQAVITHPSTVAVDKTFRVLLVA